MKQFDACRASVQRKVRQAGTGDHAGALFAEKLLTPTPFDEPIEFTYWELWHDEGARARHGAAMMSPNHAWWEGMYVVGRNFYSRFLPQLREVAGADAEALIEQPCRFAWNSTHG